MYCNIELKTSTFPFCTVKSAVFPSDELLGGELRGQRLLGWEGKSRARLLVGLPVDLLETGRKHRLYAVNGVSKGSVRWPLAFSCRF